MVCGLLDDVDFLEKSLNDYLDKKRDDFARLYFTSNKELVQLMGNLGKQSYLEVFMQKLFHGIAGLLFDDGLIVGFRSEAGEQVLLESGISTSLPPEVWLKEVEGGMRYALYILVEKTVKDFAGRSGSIAATWVKKWPGQIMLVATQVIFNHQIERVFMQRKTRGPATSAEASQVGFQPLRRETQEHIEQALAELAVEGSRSARNSLTNFVLCKIYTRDQLGLLMLEENEATQEDFNWKIMMKYHFVKHSTEQLVQEAEARSQAAAQQSPRSLRQRDDTKRVRALGVPEEWNPAKACLQDWLFAHVGETASEIAELSLSSGVARVPYGYEYAGNDLRLVVTPLTDRCFRSIFLSLHYSHGIALEGRASTGKTETAKEMAKCAGKLCFVFNCSSTLDYGSLINFFKGFVSGGSWTCFDEFNKISSSLLSILAQTITQVNQALRLQRTEITFAESSKPVRVDPRCGIFVTMNTSPPLRPANRDLPRGLLNQFRSIQLIFPHTELIVSSLLHSSGFKHAALLAKKLMTILEHGTHQLASDLSYDFSLRTVKSIVMQAQHYFRVISGPGDFSKDSRRQADHELE